MPADIRTARASDVDNLSAIENAVFEGDRISRDAFRRLIGRDSACLLVMDGGEAIAGYCAVLFRAGSGVARLYSVAAAPGQRGIGRMLLADCERRARAAGRDDLRITVLARNEGAHALYRTFGFDDLLIDMRKVLK